MVDVLVADQAAQADAVELLVREVGRSRLHQLAVAHRRRHHARVEAVRAAAYVVVLFVDLLRCSIGTVFSLLAGSAAKRSARPQPSCHHRGRLQEASPRET